MDHSPDLSKPYALDQGDFAAYRRDGHVFLPGVASAEEVRHFRPVITGLADEFARERVKEGRRSGYGAMFTQATNLWRMNEEARKFVFSKRFARIAAELMGVSGVRLYHDQALIKEPGGKPTPWHQDHYYWPLDTEHTITMWMALVDIPPEMGSMSFASGTHRKNAYPPMEISERSQEYFESLIRERNVPTPSYSLKAGDATFHSGDLLHSAHGNRSALRREVMTVIYYADGTRIMEPGYEHRRVDMQAFHPGLKAGDLAASEMNPLLYEAP
jgi:ectoine hydroxylase-related dioxygenase (phytanoyl-CoA dioxygenase family)